MAPKFIQIEIGQRFLFEGHSHVKTTPLMAINEESGKARFVPRSAMVEAEVSPSSQEPLLDSELRRAWRRFTTRCDDVLANLEGRVDQTLLEGLRRDVSAASEEFERSLHSNDATPERSAADSPVRRR